MFKKTLIILFLGVCIPSHAADKYEGKITHGEQTPYKYVDGYLLVPVDLVAEKSVKIDVYLVGQEDRAAELVLDDITTYKNKWYGASTVVKMERVTKQGSLSILEVPTTGTYTIRMRSTPGDIKIRVDYMPRSKATINKEIADLEDKIKTLKTELSKAKE
jgi:hypothetical protein